VDNNQLARIIGQELAIRPQQVLAVMELLDGGNTIPFIARYRKEATGELDEEKLRQIAKELDYHRNLAQRREQILASIAERGLLTDSLRKKIDGATKLQELEDLYLPFRPKRRTRATMAKEKGLEPLAREVQAQRRREGSWEAIAKEMFPSMDPAEAIAGALDIIAEEIADEPTYRQQIRKLTWQEGYLASGRKKESTDPQGIFTDYYDFQQGVKELPPHRVLAINRGEREGILSVKIIAPKEKILGYLTKEVIKGESISAPLLERACGDAYNRLIAPAIAREIRNGLTERAQEHGIKVFADNLRQLLLGPPLPQKTILGIDPAYRTGCKIAVISSTGEVLETATIYPHPPQNRWEESLNALHRLVEKHSVDAIAIGNGTASRETEKLVAAYIQDHGSVAYTIVNEAGASVYSASPLAREELPSLDVSLRGAVSIARRLQDPLAELVKIDPKAIGVGLYQHDLNERELSSSLAAVVESCVNYVGVDVNTASPALLSYVAGINATVARNIVQCRQKWGRIETRAQLKEVPRLGEHTFTQCAGFLRIRNGPEPLDNTAVHPESYSIAKALLKRYPLQGMDLTTMAGELMVGLPTLKDIIEALKRPGRDPREGLPGPVLRSDILSLEDLQPGQTLQGTVRNVVDFGAFVDIGVEVDGLIHISQMADHFVKDPHQILAVGDVIPVRILEIDRDRKRIALSRKGLSS
jgi:uncharacterized protein